MGLRLLARFVRLLTILAFLAGMQAAAAPLTAAVIDMKAGAPMQGSGCDSCGRDAMPAAQCAAVCGFALVFVGEPVAFVALATVTLQPTLAGLLTGRSIPPDTAPPRV